MPPRKTEKSLTTTKSQTKSAVQKTTRTPLKCTNPASKLRRVSKKIDLSIKEKMSLANEVSRAQLVALSTFKGEEPQQSILGKRTRTKANVVYSSYFTESEQSEVEKITPKEENEKATTSKDKKTKVEKATPRAVKKKATTTNEKSAEIKKPKATRKRAIPKVTVIGETPKRNRLMTKTDTVVDHNLRSKQLSQGKDNDISENSAVAKDENDIGISQEAPVKVSSPVPSLCSLSWARNISNESICSNFNKDLISDDKRFPIVAITDLNMNTNNIKTLPNCTTTDNKEIDRLSDDTSSSSSSSSGTQSAKSSLGIDMPPVALSQSTVDSSKSKETALDLLAKSNLESIDVPRRDTCELDMDIKQFIADVLGFERCILLRHEQLSRIFEEYKSSLREYHGEFLRPAEVEKPKSVNNNSGIKVSVNNKEMIKPNTEEYSQFIDNTVDRNKNDPYDDGDTLSLHAESIFGSIYESPAQTKYQPEAGEYVPRPVTSKLPVYDYRPTKIDTERTKKTVCEKQNADSTSPNHLNKDSNVRNVTTDIDSTHNAPRTPPLAPVNNVNKKFQIITSFVKRTEFRRSNVFTEMCVFSLVGNCLKNKDCKYLHAEPDASYVSGRLNVLSDNQIVREYNLIKNWPPLIHKYGNCFVNVFKTRGLTRIMLEIVVACAKTNNLNEDVRIAITESVLLHLNELDMSANASLQDLFLYKINHTDRLCDFLIHVIAKTQNFTRFKKVFVHLTYLIVKNGGSFSLDAAECLLERICIIPCEDSLHVALYEIVTHTHLDIFNNKMMDSFESHLRSINAQLLERLHAIKRQREQTYLGQPVRNALGPVPPLQKSKDGDSCANYADKERYTSPDTTNVDAMASPIEPIIKRTITFTPNMMNTSNSTSANFNERPMNNYPKWRQQRIFHKMFNAIRGPRPMMMRPMRPQGFQRQVSYRPNLSNCYIPRRPPRNQQ